MSSFGSILLICGLLGAGVATGALASVVDDAEATFWQNKAGQPIPGQWIVLFNNKVPNAQEGMDRYAAPGPIGAGGGWVAERRQSPGL
jgi:hypothetical protein